MKKDFPCLVAGREVSQWSVLVRWPVSASWRGASLDSPGAQKFDVLCKNTHSVLRVSVRRVIRGYSVFQVKLSKNPSFYSSDSK